MRTVQKGFTLAELMIVIVILSILTLIAYPSYKTYTRRVRLTEVRTTLLHNAQTMERFYRQKGTFENYDQTKLEQNTYFDITLSEVNSDHFTLKANPNTANNGETCVVTLNDGGIIASSGTNQSCPGFD